MAKETNQAMWRGVRPTDPEEPFTVKQGTAANLKVEAAIAAAQEIKTIPAIPTGTTLYTIYDYAIAETVELHQVTGGTTFHLISWFFSGTNISSITEGVRFWVTDNANNQQYRIISRTLLPGDVFDLSGDFSIPLPIPENWRIKILSPDVGVTITCFLYGYEI